jgi:spore cortex formation protein SpoVR/YcgB (stage V sporulation)
VASSRAAYESPGNAFSTILAPRKFLVIAHRGWHQDFAKNGCLHGKRQSRQAVDIKVLVEIQTKKVRSTPVRHGGIEKIAQAAHRIA